MLAKHPSGKGICIRRVSECEDGDLDAIVAKARAAGYGHVIIMIADGADVYNVAPAPRGDLAVELTRRLRAAGIAAWGWHAVYGDKPLFKGTYQPDYHILEAMCAVQRLAELRPAGLEGYVVNAEGDYERATNRARKAAEFMQALGSAMPDFPIGLASWKNPTAHPRFPWLEFRSRCDLDMPQVYWIGRPGEAAKQLGISARQFARQQPRLPYLPIGPAFLEGNWRPAPEEIAEFFETAVGLGLPAAALWDWDQLALTGDEPYNPQRLDFGAHWQAAAGYVWREPASSPFWLREPEPLAAPAAGPAPEPAGPPPGAEAELAPVLSDEPELGLVRSLEPEDKLPEWLHFADEEEVETFAEPEASTEPLFYQRPQIEAARPAPEEQEAELEFWGDLADTQEQVTAWLRRLDEPEIEAMPEAEHASKPQAEVAGPAEPASVQDETAPRVLTAGPTAASTVESALASGPEPTVTEIAQPGPLPDWLTTAEAELARASAQESEARAGPKEELPDWLAFPKATIILSEITPAEVPPRAAELKTGPAVAPERAPGVPVQRLDAVQPEAVPAGGPPAARPRGPATAIPLAAQVRTARPGLALPADDTVGRFFDALRDGQVEGAVALYGPTFVHVNSDRVERDPASVQQFYRQMLQQIDSRSLSLLTEHGRRGAVNARWAARRTDGTRVEGSDTFHLNREGRIVYHQTFYRLGTE